MAFVLLEVRSYLCKNFSLRSLEALKVVEASGTRADRREYRVVHEGCGPEFRRLCDIVEDIAATARNPQSSRAGHGTDTASVSEELGRLADLRDRGALTNEEFTEQKSEGSGERNFRV